MNLEPVIGLEIHVQLKTRSKMFCRCLNVSADNALPNSAICPICLGYPGTLPVPNEKAIAWTQRVGLALGCRLAKKSKFDRKSYFYPDLPKGYQISQYDQPFCGAGVLEIEFKDENARPAKLQRRRIGITRIHLEEDAAKNIHPSTGLGQAPYTLVDYNRAGTPLIEIVTEPDIRSPGQAKVFLQELQGIMRSLGISDADMEKGQLRCDANISLREPGAKKLNPKTEVKNLNSFRYVERALDYEIKRQTAEWEKGNVPHGATRGWDMAKARTVEQRIKEEAADYRYFPEPDIPPFVFTEDQFRTLEKDIPELPHLKRERLQRQYNASTQHARILANNPDLANFFEDAVSELAALDQQEVEVTTEELPALAKLATNLILRHIRPLMAEQRIGYQDLKISGENFAELVVLLHHKRLNASAVPQVLAEMQRTGGDPDPIIQRFGLEQVSGEAELRQFVKEVIADNSDVVARIKAGKDTAIQFLMGQVMAKTKGTGNPETIIKLLREYIG